MRDPRLAEMQFLAELDAPDANCNIRMPPTTQKEHYGLSLYDFLQMFVHLVWNGYVNDVGEMTSSTDYRPTADQAVAYANHLAEKRRQLLERYLGQQGVVVRVNHKGRLRLWELRAQLESERDIDRLTGLLTRPAFDPDIEIVFNFGRVPISVLLCDLDHFKSVNDTCGHVKGDEALQTFSHVVLGMTRKLGTAYRWGGDEFLLLLPEMDASRAADFAERVRHSVEEEFQRAPGFEKLAQRPSTTIAFATFARRLSSNDVFKQLDDVLLEAKRKDLRNRTHDANK